MTEHAPRLSAHDSSLWPASELLLRTGCGGEGRLCIANSVLCNDRRPMQTAPVSISDGGWEGKGHASAVRPRSLRHERRRRLYPLCPLRNQLTRRCMGRLSAS